MLSLTPSSVLSSVRSKSAGKNQWTTELAIVSRRAGLRTRQRRLGRLWLEFGSQCPVAVLEHVEDLRSQTLASGELLHAGRHACSVIAGAAQRPYLVEGPLADVFPKKGLQGIRIIANLVANVHENQICSSSSSSNSSEPPAAQC